MNTHSPLTENQPQHFCNAMDMPQILSLLSTAVCVIDLEMTLLYLNSAAENILQISVKRALQQKLHELAQLPEGLVNQIQKSANALQPLAHRETVWIINEQALTLDLVVTPIIKSQQVHTLVLELQVVDRILKISRDEKIQNSHLAHRALIRGLAHEVKNPLGAIRGATQLLERCIQEDQREYTQVIIQEVDRLSKLVDSMLGPRTPMCVTLCNIHEIIEHVIRLIAVEVESTQNSNQHSNQISIVRAYDLSLPEIQCDRDRLIQAILNILTNARQALLGKARQSAGSVIKVKTKIARQMTLHGRLHKLVVHLTIEDNGPGIPEELMLSLFYPLVSGRADGSGIGLSVAQHVVQQHGGIVECESTTGRTQFHIYLPADFLPLELRS